MTEEIFEDEIVQRIHQIIRSNLTNPDFSIHTLCTELAMSRSSLHRKIKASGGLSTSLLIRKVRLEESRKLLVQSDLNVSEISYQTGFSSPQNLSKYFQLTYEKSPSLYRKDFLLEQKLNLEASDEEVRETKKPLPKSLDQSHFKWLLVVLTIVAITYILWILTETPASNNDAKKMEKAVEFRSSIAVMPIDLSGDQVSELMADGFAEEISTILSQFEDLKVISSASYSKNDLNERPLKEIGQTLDVDFLVEGSLRQSGDQMKFSARLVRIEDNTTVWSENYEFHVNELFKAQSQVSLEVAQFFDQEISGDLSNMIPTSVSVDIQAYRYFLIGRELHAKRTEGSLVESIEKFDQALEIEPEFSEALAYKASAFNLLYNIGYHREAFYNDQAEIYALEAIRTNLSNGFAYAILANIYKDQLKWQQSKSMFEIALQYNPNKALINYWYSLVLRDAGLLDDAIYYSAKARELDPLYGIIHAGHVVNCLHARKLDAAKADIEKGRNLFGDSFLFLWAEAKYLECVEDFESAIVNYLKILEINPNLKAARSGIAYCQARIGKFEEANKYLRSIIGDDATSCYSRALVNAGLGNDDLAISELKCAVRKGYLPGDFRSSGYFQDLKNHNDYASIVKELGLDNKLN